MSRMLSRYDLSLNTVWNLPESSSAKDGGRSAA
jgi:hypothetical protein